MGVSPTGLMRVCLCVRALPHLDRHVVEGDDLDQRLGNRCVLKGVCGHKRMCVFVWVGACSYVAGSLSVCKCERVFVYALRTHLDTR